MTIIKFPKKLLKPVEDFLLKKQEKLEKQKKALDREDPFKDTDRLNDNAAIDAEAAEESGHERISALKNETDRTLIEIKKALSRIKIGKYGVCEKCHKMIDTDRLAVKPTATLCIKCEAKNNS